MDSTAIFLSEIVKYVGGIGIITGAVAWVLRKAIDSFLSSKLSEYKNKLERSNLEYRNELEVIITEHRVRFESLHAERAKVIRETYAKLTTLDNDLDAILRRLQQAGEPPLEEKITLVKDSYNVLRDYFRKNRIYFDEATASLLDEILRTVISTYLDVTAYPIDIDLLREDRVSIVKRGELWNKARDKYASDFTELTSRLENTFRGFLGVAT